MDLFVCHVKTGEEKKFIQLFTKLHPQWNNRVDFHTPLRQLKIRRAGKVRLEKKPLFPGYIFVETEELIPELYLGLRSIDGLLRILPDNHRIQPLPPDHREMIGRLIHRGGVLELSKVRFNENGRIQVISGPLEGLEGKIIKVDRRKQRARIRLDMYDASHMIDLGFEELQSIEDIQENQPTPSKEQRA